MDDVFIFLIKLVLIVLFLFYGIYILLSFIILPFDPKLFRQMWKWLLYGDCGNCSDADCMECLLGDEEHPEKNPSKSTTTTDTTSRS